MDLLTCRISLCSLHAQHTACLRQHMSCNPLYDSCMASCLKLNAEHGCFEGEANHGTGPVATGGSVKQSRVC